MLTSMTIEGKVQLRFTLFVAVNGSCQAGLDAVSFTVTTLAEV
ncbi:MAG: hypothetical protein O6705_03130 [Actinobacteria bacterium]|nr:hypothetical protein [Actinomycetota bacterium]